MTTWPDGKIVTAEALTHIMGPGFIACHNVGVAPMGEIWLRERGETWEARQHVAIFGGDQCDSECAGKSPFVDEFAGNYARGVGLTQEAAIRALVADRRAMADSLFVPADAVPE